MDHEKLTDLIKRYKSGSATPEEIAKLEKIWNNSSEDRSFTVDHTEAELEDIQEKMFRDVKSEILKRERKASIPLLSGHLLYKVAATLLLFLSVSLWWYSRSSNVTEVHTGFGERLTITLPDQSSVVLNGNSVLRYSNDWDNQATREVWIEGEGFFSITHTKDHQKFIVHAADHLNVEVLGTKFNVRTRHSTSEVMLAEGSVKLDLGQNKDAEQLILTPGELATMHNQQLTKQVVKQKKYTSWVENKLFFERTPLSEIVVLMRDTYGFTVTFKDPDLEKRELSGEISSATADDILYAIAETLDLKVEKEGKSATISIKHKK